MARRRLKDLSPDDQTILRWAGLRLALGVVQIGGATAGVILLILEGVTKHSIGVAALTGLVSMLSHILFPT